MGLLFGSFLNVVIARVPYEQSIVTPRSRCPKCGHQLSWYENIPIFSWLALRGRCRSCGEPISWRYPAVELLTAALFMACLSRFGWGPELVLGLVLVLLLVPLTFIDLEHWILPFSLTLPGIAAGLALSVPLGMPRLIDAAMGAAVGFLVFWGMEWLGEKIFKKEALGGGDKYLLALIGAFLTWKALLGIIFLSSLQGAVVGSLLLLIRGRAGPAPAEEPSPEQAPAPVVAQELQPPAQELQPPSGEEEEEEDDWVPGPTNIPYGPWLSAAALEVMLLGPWLAGVLPEPLGWLVAGPG
ncbi:MAG TPA: prepilin peptidase [Myxococcaceae bacterium]|nr:prepilin peptidase [Myxococcaceae bacterium]